MGNKKWIFKHNVSLADFWFFKVKVTDGFVRLKRNEGDDPLTYLYEEMKPIKTMENKIEALKNAENETDLFNWRL